MKSNNADSHFWWALEVEKEDIESELFQLYSDDIQGGVIYSDSQAQIFCSSQEYETQEQLEQLCRDGGFALLSIKKEEQTNWIEKNAEEWEPLQIDDLTIVPVIGDDRAPERKENIYYLSPGSGFGTGRHSSTRNVLRFMQSEVVRQRQPKNVLDIGTGSGILSIVAQGLYGSHAYGLDIDPDALLNARDNMNLNDFQEPAPLICGTMDCIQGEFDLILANIYAEILLDLSEQIAQRSKPDSFLIVSGIMESKLPSVLETYGAQDDIHWQALQHVVDEGWATVLFQRSEGKDG